MNTPAPLFRCILAQQKECPFAALNPAHCPFSRLHEHPGAEHRKAPRKGAVKITCDLRDGLETECAAEGDVPEHEHVT